MSFPIQAYTFGTVGQGCRFPMEPSRRFTRSILSSTSISRARHAHFFANACGVSYLGASCVSWCQMLGPTCEPIAAHGCDWLGFYQCIVQTVAGATGVGDTTTKP